VKGIRIAITAFTLLLMAVSAMGWVWWNGANQPAGQVFAGRTVLLLGMLAGIVGLVAIWRR
jgi:membrane protein YdbS with pleckstrin-like domain